MIELRVDQGSPEWFAARAGIPTASRFDQLITAKTAKPSASADRYLAELLVERLTGQPYETWDGTLWMARGTEMQAEASALYELRRNVETRAAGLCYRDERRDCACSPDRLVGDDGGVEIKCPSPAVHVQYLLANACPDEYRAQVQGSMLITGRPWWDFVSYHPDLPPLIVRCEPDPDYQAQLRQILDRFIARLAGAEGQLSALGHARAA